jgi:type VI secretion system secreted protein Hcp
VLQLNPQNAAEPLHAEETMAIDVYLQIDGIKGESADFKHAGWIECVAVQWAMAQPKSATSSTGGGHTAERAELDDITFQKLAELSSPILMQTCVMGKTIPRAKFEFLRADGQGERVKYFEIELENVLIGPSSRSFMREPSSAKRSP